MNYPTCQGMNTPTCHAQSNIACTCSYRGMSIKIVKGDSTMVPSISERVPFICFQFMADGTWHEMLICACVGVGLSFTPKQMSKAVNSVLNESDQGIMF